jgi:hypothetical protein
MPNTPKKWDDIFYSGDHGKQGSFSESDLNEMLRNFSTEFSQSKSKCVLPIVKGHPVNNDHPSFGWVDNVRLVNEGNTVKLQASYFDVDDQFKQEVNSGRYPNKSVRVAKTKDGWKLLHVGFLGATPPALNLSRTQFSQENDNDIEEIRVVQFSITQEVLDMTEQQPQSDALALLAQSQSDLKATKDVLSALQTEFTDFQAKFSVLEEENKQQKQVIQDFELHQKREKATALVSEFNLPDDKRQKTVDLVLSFSEEQRNAFTDLLQTVIPQKNQDKQQYQDKPIDVAEFSRDDDTDNQVGYMTSLEKTLLRRKEGTNG